jgi:hypothetical protein
MQAYYEEVGGRPQQALALLLANRDEMTLLANGTYGHIIYLSFFIYSYICLNIYVFICMKIYHICTEMCMYVHMILCLFLYHS